jgi:SAM-dependent methyltransferase
MLEKIGTSRFAAVSTPDPIVMEKLREICTYRSRPVFYEIGVGVGATTLDVAKLFANAGQIVLFSYEAEVAELSSDLRKLGYTNVDSNWGSPNKTFSGYHFQLAKGYINKQLPMFDVAYLDGGHVFHLDAPAAVVLKELCNPGGYILIDDWNWSLGKSPTLKPAVRPQTAEEYDREQIEECHLQLVCKIVMDTDSRFEFMGVQSDTAIYRRRW